MRQQLFGSVFASYGIRSALVIALAGGALAAQPPPAEAAGSHVCECVEYVKSSFGLRGAAGDAKDMGPFLAKNGFRRLDAPRTGAVVILQPAYYSSGEGSVYGHVAIIESTAPAGSSGWFVGMRGANQTGSQFSRSGCSNVTFKSVGPISKTSRLASYWLPPR